MFEGIRHGAKLEVVKRNRQCAFYRCNPQDVHDFERLFLAFEAAVLWTRRSNRTTTGATPDMCSEAFMHDVFAAMIDTSGMAAFRMGIHEDNAVSRSGFHRDNMAVVSKLWTDFPALLMEKAASCQVLKDLLGLDFDSLTSLDLYNRIKNNMKQEKLTKELLEHLNLDTVGRRARLSAAVFEVPTLQYWQIWHPS